MRYILPKLPFPNDALEPYIDARTMEVHYDGHHRVYVEKLNEAMEPYPDLEKRVEELLASLDALPADIRTAVRNNGGGHANHSLFWTLLTPPRGDEPSGRLASALSTAFGTFTTFKERFTDIAVEHFSNGWAWLAVDRDGKMHLFTTKDHDSPITQGMTPLLVLDLWEHAYYLKYQNRRPEFVEAFWNVVNWAEVAARWDEFQSMGFTTREWMMAG